MRLIKSPDIQRENRIPPGQGIARKWPVLHHGEVPEIDIGRWSFTISGLVAREQKLNYQQFIALEPVQVFSDVHCVTRWSMLDNLWQGVSSSAVAELAQVRPEARFVIVHAAGGFTTNLSLEDFLQPDVLFAMKHNDLPLTPEHGYPLRLVVPRLYFWKSAKWVTGIEFVAKDRPGFWESAGYHNHGDPWREERFG